MVTSRPSRDSGPVDELTRCQVECLGELEDRADLNVALPVLDPRYLGRMHAAACADLLLGQSVTLTCLEEVAGDLGDCVHAGDHLVRWPNIP